MKKASVLSALLFALPFLSLAQGSTSRTFGYYLLAIGGVINDYIVPLILAVALIIFIWNAFRYFILGGASSEGQQKAKSLALWGILAFVIIVSIWGIVNILVSSFGITRVDIICPDYFTSCK